MTTIEDLLDGEAKDKVEEAAEASREEKKERRRQNTKWGGQINE